MQENIPFRVHPRIIKELGERLVTDDFVALSELVKNSYDAGASEVTVRFGQDNSGSYIEVEDNGDGMSLRIIKEVWTVLFTPYKKILAAKNKKGRALSGEKGIGRLSAARLGRELELFTKEEDKSCYQLLLEWDNFDDLDAPESYDKWDFSDVGVLVEEAHVSPFGKKGHGTLIRISKLRRTDWLENKDLFDDVTTELSRIRPPLREYEGFAVYVEHPLFAPERLSLSGKPPEFLNYPHYFFTGDVDKYGELINTKLVIRKPGIDKTTHPKQMLGLKEGEELIDVKNVKKNRDESHCGPFSFEFRVWDLDSDSIAGLSEKYRLKRSDVREIIKLNRGVSLYRDDILVLPKSKDIDWLNLEQRRVKRVGDKISSANIVAFVDIENDKNPEIKDTADREALEKNQASEQLTEYLIEIIGILEKERKLYKSKKEDRYSFHNLFRSEELQLSLESVKESLEEEAGKVKVLKKVALLEEEIKKRDEVLAERLGYYSRLASVGTIASYMVHEVRNSSSSISACNRDGRKLLEKCESKDKATVVKRLDLSDKALNSLETLATAILPLAGAKFKRKHGEKISFKGVLENCIDANKKVIESAGVTIEQRNVDVELAMTEGELFILLQNLLQNAIYWLGRYKKGKGIVSVKTDVKLDGFITIYFDDNGPGIDPEYIDAVFIPGISSKPEGTGMGLAVVAEICEKYRGSVSAGNAKKLDGASFKLVLPLE